MRYSSLSSTVILYWRKHLWSSCPECLRPKVLIASVGFLPVSSQSVWTSQSPLLRCCRPLRPRVCLVDSVVVDDGHDVLFEKREVVTVFINREACHFRWQVWIKLVNLSMEGQQSMPISVRLPPSSSGLSISCMSNRRLLFQAPEDLDVGDISGKSQ